MLLFLPKLVFDVLIVGCSFVWFDCWFVCLAGWLVVCFVSGLFCFVLVGWLVVCFVCVVFVLQLLTW